MDREIWAFEQLYILGKNRMYVKKVKIRFFVLSGKGHKEVG